jgi:tripartite-type tricarboxylate transporter receptor subunit TctC
MTQRHLRRLLTAALLFAAAAAPAAAQDYPNGQIKMLVGFPPGGTTDIIARDVSHELEKAWHQTVIVENRAGANGALAAAQLARAVHRLTESEGIPSAPGL